VAVSAALSFTVDRRVEGKACAEARDGASAAAFDEFIARRHFAALIV